MVESKHFKKTGKAYSRSREKLIAQTVVEDEFFDPDIEAMDVGGGDPGLARLMELRQHDVVGGASDDMTIPR